MRWFGEATEAVIILQSVTATQSFALRACHGPAEWPALVRIWRSAVEATHDFLTADDIDFYERRLAEEYLKMVDVTVADADGVPVGFSGVAGGNLEMLFIDHQHRGRGAGSVLLADAMAKNPGLLVDVNEQNPQAVGFYHRHGFVTLSRSETDGDGRPFPILHLGPAESAAQRG